MMLNRGELDGERVLERETVDLMFRNHLPEGLEEGPGRGLSIGFCVVTDPQRTGYSVPSGSVGGAGVANTSFMIDLENELIFMSWTQVVGVWLDDLHNTFSCLVNQALEDGA